MAVIDECLLIRFDVSHIFCETSIFVFSRAAAFTASVLLFSFLPPTNCVICYSFSFKLQH